MDAFRATPPRPRLLVGPGAVDLSTGTLTFRTTGDPAERPQGKLTLAAVRDQLAAIVTDRADDPNLRYLDGRRLYGVSDTASLPLPDRLHPDAATHQLIAERFVELALADRGPLDPPRAAAG